MITDYAVHRCHIIIRSARISILSPLCFWHFQEAPRPTSEIDSGLPKWFWAVSGYSELKDPKCSEIFRIIRRCSEVLEDVSEYPKYCDACRLRKPFAGRSKVFVFSRRSSLADFPGDSPRTLSLFKILERCSSHSNAWEMASNRQDSPFVNLFANPFGKLSTVCCWMVSTGWHPLNTCWVSPLQNC